MRTSKAINILKESQISFYVHMAGKHGRLRVCFDSLHKCPFERTGHSLSVQTRKWINFHINISSGFHMVKLFLFLFSIKNVIKKPKFYKEVFYNLLLSHYVSDLFCGR